MTLLRGDLNNDGTIDINDIIIMQNTVLERTGKNDKQITTGFRYYSADLNNDETKSEVKWSDMSDIENDIKNIIKSGTHIRAILQPRIYFIAGSNASTPLSIIEAYDPTNDQWQQLASLSTARSMAAAAVVD